MSAGGLIKFGLFGTRIDFSACNGILEETANHGGGGLINLGLFGTRIDFQNFIENGQTRRRGD